MADLAAEAAEAAGIELANSIPSGEQHGASVQDGDNKFQKAISAWRSRLRVLLGVRHLLTVLQTLTSPQ
jgi:hypothetical protein